MEKILFETYKDYFRVGAAVSGVIFNDDFRVKIEKKIGKKIMHIFLYLKALI